MAPSSPVVVLDNGAGSCKIGFGGEPSPRKIFPNCTAKPKGERQGYVGDMLLDSKEISQLTLRRPFDRGYMINWELEREIWGRAFKSILGLGRQGSSLNTQDCSLLLSEPLFNFQAIQAATEQVVFEEFGFNAFFAAPAPLFSLRNMAALNPHGLAAQAGAGIVVDAGFSFMHVVPFFDWQPLQHGIKRIDLGGKALTNYLKELVSYRCLNMMDEPYLMECVKESLCFVSSDIRMDLKLASMRNSIHRREFVLPDGVSNFRGYVKPVDEPGSQITTTQQAAGTGQAAAAPSQQAQASQQQQPQSQSGASNKTPGAAPGAAPMEQVLVLNNERFMVPEVAFHPTDIGLQQAGITEAVTQAVAAVNPALHSLLYSNVILTGGLAACPGFGKRFQSELRPLVPESLFLGVNTPQDPITCAWEGMSRFVGAGQFHQVAMTRADYEETGGGLNAGRGR